MKQKNIKPGKAFGIRVGDFVEDSIEKSIVNGKEAPVLSGEPEEKIWYRVPVAAGITGDGSDYHIYIKKAPSDNLCVFLSGGGVASRYLGSREPWTLTQPRRGASSTALGSSLP